MPEMKYLDFDLLFERAGEKRHTARVLSSPAGQAANDFALPFTEVELENFLLKIGRQRRGMRRVESPEMEAAKNFGGKLFEAVFDGEVRGCFRSSLDEAQRQQQGLRLRLRMNQAPELADVPWEFLYNPTRNRFLSLSNETPIVRFIELPARLAPFAVKPPLRVLAMISSPHDHPPLNVQQEWANLKAAFAGLKQQRLVKLDKLEKATLKNLQHQLRRRHYHIFHFIGHGGFDKNLQDGVLIVEDETGRGREVSGQDLGTLLYDARCGWPCSTPVKAPAVRAKMRLAAWRKALCNRAFPR